MRRRLVVDDPERIVPRLQRLRPRQETPDPIRTLLRLSPHEVNANSLVASSCGSTPTTPRGPSTYYPAPSLLALPAARQPPEPARLHATPPQSVASIPQPRAATHRHSRPIRNPLRQHLHKRMHRIAKRPRLKRTLGPLKLRQRNRMPLHTKALRPPQTAPPAQSSTAAAATSQVAPVLRRQPQDRQRNSPHRPSRQQRHRTNIFAMPPAPAAAAAKCLSAAGHAVASRLPAVRIDLSPSSISGEANRCSSSRARVHAT